MSRADITTTKRAMRRRVLKARESLDAGRVHADAGRFADHTMALSDIAAARTVAVYYSVDTEPGTLALLRALLESGRRVLLPLVRPDRDLDWAELPDVDAVERTDFGLWEPTSAGLGVDAIATADAIVCPGLAVDPSGHRLGRGAGCYDRALSRVPRATPRCLLVYDTEVVESVPSGATDQLVDVAVTPTRILRLGATDQRRSYSVDRSAGTSTNSSSASASTASRE